MARYRFRTTSLHIAGTRKALTPPPAEQYICALEREYPRVLLAAQTMWGYKEMNEYFRKLSIDDRGNRAGFPPDVWDDIYMLLRLHLEIVPGTMF